MLLWQFRLKLQFKLGANFSEIIIQQIFAEFFFDGHGEVAFFDDLSLLLHVLLDSTCHLPLNLRHLISIGVFFKLDRLPGLTYFVSD